MGRRRPASLPGEPGRGARPGGAPLDVFPSAVGSRYVPPGKTSRTARPREASVPRTRCGRGSGSGYGRCRCPGRCPGRCDCCRMKIRPSIINGDELPQGKVESESQARAISVRGLWRRGQKEVRRMRAQEGEEEREVKQRPCSRMGCSCDTPRYGMGAENRDDQYTTHQDDRFGRDGLPHLRRGKSPGSVSASAVRTVRGRT